MLCLVGLPASGKSTFAKYLVDRIKKGQSIFEVKVVDPDNIRNKIMKGSFDPDKEQKVREENLSIIKKSLKDRFVVISDDLNYYTSMRHDLKEIAVDQNKLCFFIHISTPLEVCLKWNDLRGSTIPNDIIRDINDKFDNFDKYKWDTPLAIYDLSLFNELNSIIDELLQKISQIIQENLESKRKIKKNSLISSNLTNEKIDQITRKIVGELFKNPKNAAFKKQIIRKRKKFIKIAINKIETEAEISTRFKNYLANDLNVFFSK